MQWIGLARRAGKAVIGARAVRAALRRGRIAALVLAGDAAESAATRLGRVPDGVSRLTLGTRSSLGRAVGRAEVAVVGITDRRLAERLVEEQRGAGRGNEVPEPSGDRPSGAKETPRRRIP